MHGRISRRLGRLILSVVTIAGLTVPAAWSGEPQIWNTIKKHADTVQKKTAKVQEAAKPMSVEEEKDVGREVAAKVVGFSHLYKNDELRRYVNLVGATVAAQSERREIQYHFAVLDTDDINAFSAPGGYVFITRGAVALC